MKSIFKGALLSSAALYQARQIHQDQHVDTSRHALCILYPDNRSGVHGLVSFSQSSASSPCKVAATVKGLSPDGQHGFHIHQYGDLTEGCKTAGGHYNPHQKNHGGPMAEERHVGDLGNIKADAKGNGYYTHSDSLITLFGDMTIFGRSCVVHKDTDDLGQGGHSDSLTTGHAGARLACGVIG